jgi:hypothetical protein
MVLITGRRCHLRRLNEILKPLGCEAWLVRGWNLAKLLACRRVYSIPLDSIYFWPFSGASPRVLEGPPVASYERNYPFLASTSSCAFPGHLRECSHGSYTVCLRRGGDGLRALCVSWLKSVLIVIYYSNISSVTSTRASMLVEECFAPGFQQSLWRSLHTLLSHNTFRCAERRSTQHNLNTTRLGLLMWVEELFAWTFQAKFASLLLMLLLS